MNLPESIRTQLRDYGVRIRIGFPWWMAPFLRGFGAMTLGRTIYLAPRLVQQSQEALETTLRHELAHVRQQQRLGLVRFVYRYGAEYVQHRLKRRTHQQAYDAISFEKEAREEEGKLV